MRKPYLEFIRGAASVCVLLYHLPESWFRIDEYRRFSLADLGADAVALFFILSGCVINMSYSRKPGSRRDFLASRLLRLYPQFLLGVSFGVLAAWILWSLWPPVGQLLGNIGMLSTLQGFIVESLPGNSVVWSLTFEMFFYIVFALAIGRFRKRVVLCWSIVSVLMIPLCYFRFGVGVLDHFIAMMAFSAIWLVGYYLYEYRQMFYVDGYAAAVSLGSLPMLSRIDLPFHWPGVDPSKHFLFAIIAIPFFRYCLQTPPTGKKIGTLITLLICLGLAVLFNRQPGYSLLSKVVFTAAPAGIAFLYWCIHRFGLQARAAAAVSRIGIVLGKYSYSLYMAHVPVLILCAEYLRPSVALYLGVSLPAIALLTWWLESWFQPRVVRWFRGTVIRP